MTGKEIGSQEADMQSLAIKERIAYEAILDFVIRVLKSSYVNPVEIAASVEIVKVLITSPYTALGSGRQ